MKCTYCKAEIGKVKDVFVCLCKMSFTTHLGMILQSDRNEFCGWISEQRMYCRNCADRNFLEKNFRIPTEAERKRHEESKINV